MRRVEGRYGVSTIARKTALSTAASSRKACVRIAAGDGRDLESRRSLFRRLVRRRVGGLTHEDDVAGHGATLSCTAGREVRVDTDRQR